MAKYGSDHENPNYVESVASLKRKTKDDFLSQIYVAQAKDISLSASEKDEQIKYYSEKWDDMKHKIGLEAETISFTTPKEFTGTQTEWNLLKNSNPTLSDERLIEEYNKLK